MAKSIRPRKAVASKTTPGGHRVHRMEAPSASSFATSDTILVNVGTQAREFILHQKLLTFHSEFFRGALSGKFKETNDGTVTLIEIETKAFDVFVEWIYDMKLPTWISLGLLEGEGSFQILSSTCQAYVAADMLIVPELKEALFNELYSSVEFWQGPDVLFFFKWLFDNLPEDDPLLQYVVDAYCVTGGISRMTKACVEMLHKVPKELLIRVLVKLHELSKVVKKSQKLHRADYKFTQLKRKRSSA